MITTTCWILWIPTRLGVGGSLESPHAEAAAHTTSAPMADAAPRPTRTRSLRFLRQLGRGADRCRIGLRSVHQPRQRFCRTGVAPDRRLTRTYTTRRRREGRKEQRVGVGPEPH